MYHLANACLLPLLTIDPSLNSQGFRIANSSRGSQERPNRGEIVKRFGISVLTAASFWSLPIP
jgi:hypothetical protein